MMPEEELVREEYDAGESATGEKYEFPYRSFGDTALCICVRRVSGACLAPLEVITPGGMLSPVVDLERKLVLEAFRLAAE